MDRPTLLFTSLTAAGLGLFVSWSVDRVVVVPLAHGNLSTTCRGRRRVAIAASPTTS